MPNGKRDPKVEIQLHDFAPPVTPHFHVRHQYDDFVDAYLDDVTSTENTEPSLTQTQYADDVDLNVMLRRMGIDEHKMPDPVLDPAHYGDFTNVVEYREALHRVMEAQQSFAALPAALRARFDNDPVKLFAFVSDPKNDEEAVELGLLKRIPPPTPAEIPKPEEKPAPPAK